jgi:hypothetical protein
MLRRERLEPNDGALQHDRIGMLHTIAALSDPLALKRRFPDIP